MNGVHDLGGMHGMGRIPYERNEPAFHAPWEARMLGLLLAMGRWRKWNGDAFRHEIETMPPADYLGVSYYERWIPVLGGLMVKGGLVTPAELASGKPAPGTLKATPPLTAAQVTTPSSQAAPPPRQAPNVAARFSVGQRVRARNIHPTGHTRLPRYTRGKVGTVERDYGVYTFPDTNAHSLGEKPQHVYSIRFTARDLWGEQASARDTVYVDLWDDYLESA